MISVMKAWYAEIYSGGTVRLAFDAMISKVRSPFFGEVSELWRMKGWRSGDLWRKRMGLVVGCLEVRTGMRGRADGSLLKESAKKARLVVLLLSRDVGLGLGM